MKASYKLHEYGKGRGGSGSRSGDESRQRKAKGGGRGMGGSDGDNGANPHVLCHRCNEKGHVARVCRAPTPAEPRQVPRGAQQ